MNPASRRSRGVLPAFEDTCSEFQKRDKSGRREIRSSTMKKMSRLDVGVANLEEEAAAPTKRPDSLHQGSNNNTEEKHPTAVKSNPFIRKDKGAVGTRAPGVIGGMRPCDERPGGCKDKAVLQSRMKNLRGIMKKETDKERKEKVKRQISELDAELQILEGPRRDSKAEEIAKRDRGRDFDNAMEEKDDPYEYEVQEVIEPPSNSDLTVTTRGSKRSKGMVAAAQGQGGNGSFSNQRLQSVFNSNMGTMRAAPLKAGANKNKASVLPWKPSESISPSQFFGPTTSSAAPSSLATGKRRTRSGAIEPGSSTLSKLPRKPPPPKAPDSPVEILDDTTDEDEADKTLPLQEDPITLSSGHRRSARLANTPFGSQDTALWRKLKDLKAVYPAGNPADCTPISSEDLSRLAPEEFLNDSVIDFYLRFLRHNEMKDHGELKGRCHFFNSYFYKKLTERPKDGTGFGMHDRHARVKRWTKGVDIFEKDFLFVPIHDALHWSLAIICYPGGSEGGRSQPTQILHLDSLSGCHNTANITQILRTYLQVEWLEKQEVAGSIPGCYAVRDTEAKPREFGPKNFRTSKLSLPQQGNHTDCGLFLLTFLQYFIFSAPHLMSQDYDFCSPEGLKEIRSMGFPGAEDFLSRSWFRPSNASQLRCFLQYQILKVLYQQRKLEDVDPRVGHLEEGIKEYEARTDNSRFKPPFEDIPFRPPKRRRSQADDVITLNDSPHRTRRNPRHVIFQSEDEDDDDDISQGSGDWILKPQSMREHTRSSAAGAAAVACCAPADASEGEAVDPGEPMEVNLSQGLDNVHLSSGSRPRGGGGPRRDDPEEVEEALEGEAGGAWEDEEAVVGQGQEAQPPEDVEAFGEEDELEEGEEQGEGRKLQPLWTKAPDPLSKAPDPRSARSTPPLDDDDEEGPQGSFGALQALQRYGNRSEEGEPEAGGGCSGEEDELEGGDRRARESTPVSLNGPTSEVNRSRPPSPDVLLEAAAAEPIGSAGRRVERGPAANEVPRGSEEQGQEGFRWIDAPQHDLKDRGSSEEDVFHDAKGSFSISGSEEVPPTQAVSVEQEEEDARFEQDRGAGGGPGPGTQASAAGHQGAARPRLQLTSREDAAQGGGGAESTQAGSSCFPQHPQQHQGASYSPPGGAGFAVHQRRLSGESRQHYRKPAGSLRADNSSGAPPGDDCVISSSSPSATSSGNLQASVEEEVEAEEPPNRRRLTDGQRGKAAAAASAPDKARHEIIEII